MKSVVLNTNVFSDHGVMPVDPPINIKVVDLIRTEQCAIMVVGKRGQYVVQPDVDKASKELSVARSLFPPVTTILIKSFGVGETTAEAKLLLSFSVKDAFHELGW